MRRFVLALCVCMITVIGIILLVECGGELGPPGGGQPTGKIPLPTVTPRQPTGEPAITPTLNGVPAFTREDVVKYVTTHPMPFGDANGPVTPVEIRFITSKEVNRIINRQDTGIPDNYLLCFVRLTGTFTFSGPPTSGRNSSSGTYTQAYEVFDATTGNLLMGGALGPSVP